MVKPSRPQGDITFRRHPVDPVPGSFGAFLGFYIAIPRFFAFIRRVWSIGCPAGLTGMPFLIAHPPGVRPDIPEDHGPGLHFPGNAPGGIPVIIDRAVDISPLPGPTVVSISPIGPIMPGYK